MKKIFLIFGSVISTRSFAGDRTETWNVGYTESFEAVVKLCDELNNRSIELYEKSKLNNLEDLENDLDEGMLWGMEAARYDFETIHEIQAPILK